MTTARNYLLTPDDEALLTNEMLMRHADYAGDHEVRLALRAMSRKLLSIRFSQMDMDNVIAWLNSPVDVMQVSRRVMNVIHSCGFTTIRQVFEIGHEYMLRQNSFGLRCKKELDQLFESYGLVWPGGCNDAPKGTAEAQTIEVPLDLFDELAVCAHQLLARFERDHGRFATRGKRKEEHERMTKTIERVDAVKGSASA